MEDKSEANESTDLDVLKELENQFDVWVLELHNDNHLSVIIPVTALMAILELDVNAVTRIVEAVETNGKAPIASGSKEEMVNLSQQFAYFGLMAKIEQA